jgi:bleomycin hydrolase
MLLSYYKTYSFICLLFVTCSIFAQKDSINYSVLYEIKSTPIKSQYFTGTCWNFSTISFLESEMIRNNNLTVDLSEMYIVRNNYSRKAECYTRNHGLSNFAQGGQAHDVIKTIMKFGIVPEETYPVIKNNNDYWNHVELFSALKGMLDGIIKNNNGEITNNYSEAVNALLDVYLGKQPQSFIYNKKEYTPTTFLNDVVKLNLNDYIEITSFQHQPFYEKIRLQMPDNWDQELYYNIPLDELVIVVNQSIKNGYSVVWDGDVSDNGYDVNKTLYSIKSDENRNVIGNSISQEIRQKAFDSWQTTDDHLMHIIGLVENKNHELFFKIKDSAGENHPYNYMSEAYFRKNTIAIMINKNALSPSLRNKLKL